MKGRYNSRSDLRNYREQQQRADRVLNMIRNLCTAVIVMCIASLLLFCMSSCTTTRYVPVVETHDVHHYHTDSIHNTDSVIHEKETLIMQLDSAAMAQYGIQLKSAERAWLVKTKELELQIQKLMELKETKDSVRDSVPYPVPYEVINEVPKQLTWWQKTQMIAGDVLLAVLFGLLCFGGWKLIRKFGLFI